MPARAKRSLEERALLPTRPVRPAADARLGCPATRQSSRLTLSDRQSSVVIDRRLLQQLGRLLLRQFPEWRHCELGVLLVTAPEMRRLNETFVRHRGITDVITFDYSNPGRPEELHGEIVICPDEARVQARRFRCSWQAELVRYLVHGVLHLRGYDDSQPAARRRMRQEEDRLVRILAARFRLGNIGKVSATPAAPLRSAPQNGEPPR